MLGIQSLTRGRLMALGAIAIVGQQLYKTYRSKAGKSQFDGDMGNGQSEDLKASPHSYSSTSDNGRDLSNPEERLDQTIEDSFPASDPGPLH